jgi:ketosteroid isomerase-like protein
MMRRLLVGGALAALVVSLSACGGGSSRSSASVQQLQRQADLYAIDQIERTWHRAISRHDIDLLMTLWAPNATFTASPGQTYTGKHQIRHFFVDVAKITDPKVHWVLDTPAYKIRETANGDRGTLYFECDHIDLRSRRVVAVTAADMQVARINGRWLITDNIPVTPHLSA